MTSLPILLPSGFTPIVHEGESVTPGQIIATYTDTAEEMINVAKLLSLPLSRAAKTLAKLPGEYVRPGDVLAIKKNLFGAEKERLISKCEGTIMRYERSSGNLVIQTATKAANDSIISPVAGTVALCNNGKVVIATDKNVIAADGGWGETAEGELFVLEETPSIDGLLFQLDSRAIGKIVASKKLTKDLLCKGIGIGAKGMIGVTIAEEDVTYVENKKFPLPIVSVNTQTIAQVLAWRGKKVFLDAKAKAVILLQV